MSKYYERLYTWSGDVPDYCNGKLKNLFRNRNSKLVELGVFYDSTISGIFGSWWFCEDCHNSFGAGSQENDHSAKYELQKDGSWLLTEGGKYYRQSSDMNMVNYQDKFGNTVLHNVIASGEVGFVKYLLDFDGIDVSIKNDHEQTPEDLAKIRGNNEIMKQFSQNQKINQIQE